MGLDCSHGAFHGAYSAFNQLRQQVCKAVGGRYPYFSDEDKAYLREKLGVAELKDGWWYVPDGVTREAWPGLYLFLEHSDCDGEFTPNECRLVADDLERIFSYREFDEDAGAGHIGQQGGYRNVLQKFIAGCRLAAERGEALDFH